PPPADWVTLRLYGAPDRADAVLAGLVGPFVAAARASGTLERWFFLRYLEAPGRHHLRVRLSAPPARLAALAGALEEALAPALAAGDLVSLERGPYLPERGRFGADGLQV